VTSPTNFEQLHNGYIPEGHSDSEVGLKLSKIFSFWSAKPPLQEGCEGGRGAGRGVVNIISE